MCASLGAGPGIPPAGHGTAERGESEPEQQRNGSGLLLVAAQASEQDGGAGAHQREREDHRRGSERIAPGDAEGQQRAEHDDERLDERDRQAPEHLAGEDRPRGGRGGEHAPGDPQPACLDQPDRATERREEDEQQQLRARPPSNRLSVPA
jgi:hypothetical protein